MALVLTRQKLPIREESLRLGWQLEKGAYILREVEGGHPDIVLLASGSKVELILQASEQLKEQDVNAQVVSIPSFELFDRQPQAYKDMVLPRDVRKRLAVEAAAPLSWYKYVELDGEIIGMTGFGASAPDQKLFEKFGFTVEYVAARALKLLGRAADMEQALVEGDTTASPETPGSVGHS
jgi:transketolase